VNVSRVAVSMDADGDAVVAYKKNGLYVARVSKDGVLSASTQVTSSITGDPDVSMDSAGDYFVSWINLNSPLNQFEARVQAFDSNGTARAAAFNFTTLDALKSMDAVKIDAKPDGSAAAIAVAERFESAADAVYYGRVTSSAIDIAATAISSGGTPNNANPAVAVNADGSFEVGYTTYDKVGGSGGDPVTLSINVQRIDATGAAVGSPIVLWPASNDASVPKDNLHTPYGLLSLDAGTGAGGGFVASWAREIYGGVSIDIGPTLVESFDAQGVADSDGPFTVTHDSFSNDVGVDDDGNVVVTYLPDTAGSPLRFLRLSPTQAFASVQNGVLYVAGTGGDDTISISASGANLVVTRGNDTLNFLSGNVNVLQVDGFDGNDTITNNTAVQSTLRGGDGSDTLFGGIGIDRIHGGIGNDSLWGGAGPDKIFGEDGVDSCYGNGGSDRIEGGAQHDHIRGNAGHDMLLGNGGNDQIFGGADADRIYGGPGVDQIWGEGGNDRLYGDDGFADTLHGGAGDDIFITVDGVADQLFGDGGHDTAIAIDQDKDLLTSIEATT
jgi:Ca2+-binding RTX toxin-like protein